MVFAHIILLNLIAYDQLPPSTYAIYNIDIQYTGYPTTTYWQQKNRPNPVLLLGL